jgi:uncharacterized membrane protein
MRKMRGDEPVRTSARQHLVDAYDMEGMDANPEVEGIFTGSLCDIFVGTNAGCFECFTGELLVLVRNEVAAERELVDGGTLTTEIEYTNLWRMRMRKGKRGRREYLWVWNTSIVTRLWIGLVLAVSVAACRTTTHS